MRGIVLTRMFALLVLCAASGACKTISSPPSRPSDTTTLARNNSPFIINSKSPSHAFVFKEGKKVTPGKKISLILHEVAVTQYPEGVLEVYVSKQSKEPKELNSQSSDFLNVLDLFSLQSDGSKKVIIDMSSIVQTLQLTESLFPITITILFRGNTMPNGNESTNAGHLSFGGLQIVEITE